MYLDVLWCQLFLTIMLLSLWIVSVLFSGISGPVDQLVQRCCSHQHQRLYSSSEGWGTTSVREERSLFHGLHGTWCHYQVWNVLWKSCSNCYNITSDIQGLVWGEPELNCAWAWLWCAWKTLKQRIGSINTIHTHVQLYCLCGAQKSSRHPESLPTDFLRKKN